ncbi:hypothetical protein [Sporosarcina sp. G11-34]|uniref:hypothetical protein n=1 Tax=Sporosarcina sp. G11-34 TaxID=2849605 RepID=UPI0022A9F22D|nr:hypothetical protein [Sporosarcina sp. G11-34]MCZ2258979.1 hypothetical protein [Sporosarcina sp. G11-34]
MHIIIYNEPILFVHGPPVFIKAKVEREESTSIFLLNTEEVVDSEGDVENEQEEVEPVTEGDPSIRSRIIYLSGDFRKEIYQPLQFQIGDEILKGIIDKVEGETVFIVLHGKEEEIVAVELTSIEEVLWRGQPFLEE